MRDAIVEQDARGVITAWSDEAAALYGWTRDEAIGMRSHRLVPERNRQRHDDTLERLVGNQRHRDADDRRDLREPRDPRDRRDRVRPAREELTALHRDGHEFRADVSLSVDGEGDRLRIVATVRAATPETRADAAFRQNERFKSILDQIDDGCAVVDLRGNLQFVNDAFCRMFGFEKARVLGRSFKDLQHPDRHAQTLEIFSSVYRTGEPVRSYEYQVSSTLFVDQSISLERDDSGRPVAFLSIFRDCTARKQAEEATARAHAAAEAANRAKSEFLANMSHEIRTPMNGIIGMTELALDGPLTPPQAECLDMIRSQAASLLTIINDILDFSKIESRRVELESVPFTLSHAIDEVVRPLAVRAREKGITLGSSIAASVPARIVGDPVRLKQILINLIGNAVKFTEEGSVTLEVTVQHAEDGRHIAAPARQRHRHRHPAGEAERDLRAFPPGGRLDDAAVRRHRPRPGDLVDAGRADGRTDRVESTPGGGSTFDIAIPAVAAPPNVRTESAVSAEVAATARRMATPAKAARILIAEDNIVNQRVAAALLDQARPHGDGGQQRARGSRRAAARTVRSGADGRADARDGRLRGDGGDPRAGARNRPPTSASSR